MTQIAFAHLFVNPCLRGAAVLPAAVLGDQPVALGSLSLGDVGMQMSKAGQVVSIGAAAACLGDPLRAAYWLARTMAAK